nr:ribonuclease H-like domain-containing protein [Tanacetum cinerariifolium]
SAQTKKHDDKTKREAKGKSPVELSTGYRNLSAEFEDFSDNSINEVNAADSPVPAISPIPTTRVHKDHPVTQIIDDLSLATKTRSMTRVAKDQGIEAIRLFLAYASFMGFMVYQIDVKSAFLYGTIKEEVYVSQPPGFEDPDYPNKVYKVVKAIHGLHQAPRAWQQGDILLVLDLYGKSASTLIDTKKPLLKDPDVYQMDVKSAFLYGTIEEEVYVCQPQGFKDLEYSDKVYKVVKALYELHQAPRAWYETLATYLLENGFQRGTIDQTLFIKKQQKDILLSMSAKRTSWNEFSSAMASAVICLSTGRTFNFSKYIFESLVRNVDSSSKFYMYPRRVGKGCSGVETSLFEGMLVAREPEEQGDAEEQGHDDNAAEEPVIAVDDGAHFPMSLLQEALDVCAALAKRVEHLEHDKVAQDLEIIKLKSRVKKLERVNKRTVIATSSTKAEYVAGASCYGQVLWIQNQMLDYSKSDASEGFDQIINFINGSYIAYALTVNPTIYVSCIKQFWRIVAVKFSNYVTRLQALVAKKRVMVTEAAIRDALHLDDAEGVDCLPNEDIFTELARMGYEKPTTKLTFYKAFFSSQWKFLIHTILRSMSVKRTSSSEFSSMMESAMICLSTGRKFNFSRYIFESLVRNVDSSLKFYMYPRFIHLIIQNQLGDLSTHSIKHISPALTQNVIANMRRVGKGCSGVETPLFEGMISAREPENQGNTEEQGDEEEQGTDNAAAEEPVTDVDDVVDQSIQSPTPLTPPPQQPQDIPSTSQAYMQEDESEVQEVVEIITTAKLITKVVDAVGVTVSAVAVIPFTVPETISAAAIPARGVVIRDPKEESSTKTPTETTSKDKGKEFDWEAAIDHVKQRAKEEPFIQRYQVMKKRPQTEAQARRNMMMYLKNIDGFTLDFFKGMSYDDIPKRKKLIKEAKEAESIQQHLQIVPDEDDDVFTEATPLARKVPVVDYKVILVNNKPRYKIIKADDTHQLYASFITMLKIFDREDLETLWRIVKERKMSEEAQEADDLRRNLEIVQDEDDDVFVEATPLAQKVPVVDYQIVVIENKPKYKIIRANDTHQFYISFITLLKNFDKEDLETL